MEQTTLPEVFSVAVPLLILKASRAREILLAPLHGIKAVSSFVVSASQEQERSGSAKKSNSLPDAISLWALIERLFNVARPRTSRDGAGSARTTPRQEELSARGLSHASVRLPLSVGSPQALLERIDLLERKLAAAGISVPAETDWVQLVKTGTLPASPSGAPVARVAERVVEAALGRAGCDEKTEGLKGAFNLANRKVLCVGGRAALYPEYRRLVHASGGKLFFHRSEPRLDGDELTELLAQADMVVCPLDCVNHHAYFSVKRYCKHSGTPCAMLERSDIPTFCKGIATLARVTHCVPGNESNIRSTNPPSPVSPAWKRRVDV